MFANSPLFNNGGSSSISGWNVSNVTSMNSMFLGQGTFNQPIGNWNVSKVTNMNNMFFAATSFNQDLGNWNVTGVTNFGRFIDSTAISKTNYDNLLVGWSGRNLKNNLSFQANRTYSPSPCAGGVARASIISNYGWNFISDIAGSCP
jgi:surface protein